MAPNISDCIVAQEIKPCETSTENNGTKEEKLGTTVLEPDPNNNLEIIKKRAADQNQKPGQSLVWRNIVIISYAHIAAAYGIYHMCTDSKTGSVIFGKLTVLTPKHSENLFCYFLSCSFCVGLFWRFWYHSWCSSFMGPQIL